MREGNKEESAYPAKKERVRCAETRGEREKESESASEVIDVLGRRPRQRTISIRRDSRCRESIEARNKHKALTERGVARVEVGLHFCFDFGDGRGAPCGRGELPEPDPEARDGVRT